MPDNNFEAPDNWLFLIHQIPAKPAYLRVKVWRRLQGIGAASVKNAVYALPASETAETELRDILGEINRGGGEALICRARLTDGLSDADLRGVFDAMRDADYDELAREANGLLVGGGITAATLARLRKRRDEIAAIDFFGAHGRQAIDSLLLELEQRMQQHPPIGRQGEGPSLPTLAELKGRVWVTRQQIHADRIASAWLILRFIDEDAHFKFVEGQAYHSESGELRFDMTDAEFTHEGDFCTFETLLARTGRDGDPALKAIAEIIHDIDIRDGKFSRAETAGVKALIAGITTAAGDEVRITRGTAAFDDLYAYFRKSRGA